MLSGFIRLIWLLTLIVGISFGLAYALQRLKGKLRSLGYGLFGRAYVMFLAPGVACHELGHAVGCWLTGNRVRKIVFFSEHDETHPNYLGYVQHDRPCGWLGPVESAIICTGPLWFGCVVILLLSRILLGTAVVIDIDCYVDCSVAPGVVEYLTGCFRAAVVFLMGVSVDGVSTLWRFPLWCYLAFCVGSGAGMSWSDISHASKGMVIVVAGLAILAATPFVGKWFVAGVCFVLPIVFVMHTVMAVGIVVEVLVLGLGLILKNMIRDVPRDGMRGCT